MIGNIIDCSRSLNGKPRITFEVDAVDELRGLDGELTIEVKKRCEKRSLNANAYFHVLVNKMADAAKISKTRMKNELLGKYGQREVLEDGPTIISVLSRIDMLERSDIHCVAVGYGKVNDKDFTHWAIIKPSHEYNTKEMAELIDGTIEDAKAMGIPTATPDEIERMKMLWSQS